MTDKKDTILFLCTGNSCRSQMAEAFMNKYHSGKFISYSAGTNPSGVNRRAAEVMKEKGIDISSNASKHIDELPVDATDFVLTVCDHAKENCPFFPARKKSLHHSFDDPPALEKDSEKEEEKLQHYRRVRDEIEEYIKDLPEKLSQTDDKKMIL
jgi:arsenate reductase